MTKTRKRSAVAAKPINVVVDLSHHNEKVDFVKMKADGIVAVIHNATQGLTYVDKTYATRQKAASKAGLLWGRVSLRRGRGWIGPGRVFSRDDPAGRRDPSGARLRT